MQQKGMPDTFEEVLQAVKDRDNQDMNRKVEPLRQAEDAVLVDSTNMTFDEVVDAILAIVEEKRHG
jgi:cytidylate kinase